MTDDTLDWFECRAKLPSQDGMLVVMFDPNNYPTVWPAKWNADRESFDGVGTSEATHWMPLPVAPKSPWWSEGFKAAAMDEEVGWPKEFTHNPYQPTSPYTYPDYHCGCPSFQASEWEAGYHYRQFEHQRSIIRLKITHMIGNKTIEMYM